MLDKFDRMILGGLVEDAHQTFAALGRRVGLSPPAVHERVKRLRRRRVVQGTSARLDGAEVGKPFLAFVKIELDGWGKSRKLLELARFPEVEELHSITGDAGLLLKVRTADAHALECLLAELYAFPGVRKTTSTVVLSTFIERPVQAEVTTDWPDLHMIDD